MKLIIQIPCFNERDTLPLTLKDLPTRIEGIDRIETLVIDDGSSDGTSRVARELGVNHIIKFSCHKGLAKAFAAGIEKALSLGADIIVNTDADNQYRGECIKDIVKPILEGKADIVIGERDIDNIKDFSPLKKFTQKLGSWVVRQLSGTEIKDTTSGFRAFKRDAAMRLNIISEFSYTLETIIQAGKKKLSIVGVKIKTNNKLRDSRLFSNTLEYIFRSAVTIIRVYVMYEPLKTFFRLGALITILGIIGGLRFLYFYFLESRGGHLHSLLLSVLFLIIGFQVIVFGMLSDLIYANRRLIEDLQYFNKKKELDKVL